MLHHQTHVNNAENTKCARELEEACKKKTNKPQRPGSMDSVIMLLRFPAKCQSGCRYTRASAPASGRAGADAAVDESHPSLGAKGWLPWLQTTNPGLERRTDEPSNMLNIDANLREVNLNTY